MISVKNLFLAYSKEYNALNDINFEIKDGEKIALLGDNESGKTTLIRAIIGLEEYYKGEIYFDNKNIKKTTLGKMFAIAYISSKGIFLENKSVLDNLKYVLKIRHTDQVKIDKSINESLLKFGLDEFKNLRLKDLNNYQRLLVQLCRANLRKVDYYFIDNIFKSISDEEVQIIMNYILGWQKENDSSTFVVATEKAEIAEKISNRIIKIHLGSII